MLVYIFSKKSNISASAEYDTNTGKIKVLAGSRLSSNIHCSATFRGAKSVSKYREGIVDDNKLLKDIEFNSPSTAANFVTGQSCNGLILWKDSEGKKLKELLNK